MFSYIKRFFSTNISFLIILIIVIFALYGKAINYELTNLDDDILTQSSVNFISNNNNFFKLFLTSCYYDEEHQYYRPILPLSFITETKIFGFNLNIYHLTNIILFILCLYLLYIFFIQIKANKNISKFVILLLSVHPILTSVAVWIPARNDSLLLIFTILSFIFLIKYLENNTLKNITLFFIFFSLALFTKETAVILTVVYFYFIYVFKYKINIKQIKNIAIYFFIIIILYFILRHLSVQNVTSTDFINNYSLLFYNTFKGLMLYTYCLIIPEYIPVLISDITINIPIIIVNCSVLLFIIYLYISKFIDRRKIIFCLLWYLLFITPTFLILEQQLLFHRLLIPLLSILYLIILISEKALKKYPVLKKYFIILFAILFISLFYASYMHADKFKDEESFTINIYLDSPNNRISYDRMFNLFIKKQDFYKAKELIENKISKSKTTIKDIVYITMLNLLSTGNLKEAEYAYLQLEQDMKGMKELIYVPLSEIYYIKEDYQKAFDYIQKAYKLKPYDTTILKQLAKIDEKTGNIQQALDIYINLSKIEKSNKEYKDKISLLGKKIKKID